MIKDILSITYNQKQSFLTSFISLLWSFLKNIEIKLSNVLAYIFIDKCFIFIYNGNGFVNHRLEIFCTMVDLYQRDKIEPLKSPSTAFEPITLKGEEYRAIFANPGILLSNS